ncbi:ATP-binding protein [Enterococcus hirae]|uniref:ATP-binding protein n=1 Tax=Enterococcus hirae TaxID=1354 RepID=UPI0036538A3E
MGKINFNVDAYTARLIGRENISGLRGALFELIKNTYDADASMCILYYADDTLYIADNGTGMNSEIIINNWMTIGRSTKKEQFTSKKGRIQTGAKGIGRFALDRLGDKSKMITINNSNKLLWEVDWKEFDNNHNITDITAELSETNITLCEFIAENCKNEHMKKLVEKHFTSTGTIFKISDLRDEWNTPKFIDNTISQLSTLIPETLSNVFKLYFFTDDWAEEKAEIQNVIENDYDYKINFKVQDGDNVKISIHRNEFDFGDDFDHIIKEAEFSENDIKYFNNTPIEINKNFSEVFKKRDGISNTIGEFSGNIYFAKITNTKKDKKKYYYREIHNKKIEPAFSGIKLYRDNFRVRPYGEYDTSSYDWLLLSSRKQKSPAAVSHSTGNWRVSSEQVYGSIFISRLNLNLPDQSNREGIIETPEFKIFKNFIREVISCFEKDRQYVFRKLDRYYKKKNEAERIQKEIEEKSRMESKEKDIKEFSQGISTNQQENNMDISSPFAVKASDAKKVIDQKESIIKELEDENKLLRALATTGIVTNTYIHEIKGITHTLNMNVVNAYEELTLDRDVIAAEESLQKAIFNKESLNSWFEVTLNSIKKDKRTWKKNNLVDLFKNQLASWKDILDQKGISISFDCIEEEIYFYCHHFEIESIVNNLLTNSFYAFSTPIDRTKRIEIALETIGNEILIKYEDNGPGLPSIFKKNPKLILEAMESEKKDENGDLIGTGMGMWIIDRTIMDYKGDIDLSKNKEKDYGFYIDIKLSKGERK